MVVIDSDGRRSQRLKKSPAQRLLRFFGIAVLLGFSLLAHQFLLFNYLYYSTDAAQRADAVVVFDGMTPRLREGFKLLAEGRAPNGIISPATQAQIRKHVQAYGNPEAVQFLLEPRARTTYENAFFTGQIIIAANVRSVILVTSQDHMPRSFLLLEGMLVGKRVKVHRMPVLMPRTDGSIGSGWLTEEKLIYNEMVKSWGSLYEWVTHKLTGRLAPRGLRHSMPINAIEEWVMMD